MFILDQGRDTIRVKVQGVGSRVPRLRAEAEADEVQVTSLTVDIDGDSARVGVTLGFPAAGIGDELARTIAERVAAEAGLEKTGQAILFFVFFAVAAITATLLTFRHKIWHF